MSKKKESTKQSTEVSKVKDTQQEKVISSLKSKTLFKEVWEHKDDSWTDMVSPQLTGWDEKESILVNKLIDEEDVYVNKSQVFDPRLSTIVLERAARVMAQNPTGKAMAISRDDLGKNLLMNLLLDKWILPNANAQFDFLIKCRLWDIYSLVYGSLFALTDWVSKDDFSSPDFFLLPIRDCHPQPGKYSLNDADWFGVTTHVNEDWLKARNKDSWKNIDTVLLKIKDGQNSVKGQTNDEKRSYVERTRQPSTKSDNAFKQIEIYTEYRKDRWITICSEFGDEKLVLRDIPNPQKNNKLPITAKYGFPLLDSIYGLGEFERGKTLQFAVNSLINLYLDGVKMSIFPPIILNPDGIVPSTIVQEPASKWLEIKPNSIRQFQSNTQGIATFQSTYSFLTAALMNQAGTTDTTVSKNVDITQGKTPQALKMLSVRESARDSWDRFMMEKALEEVLGGFVDLTVKNFEKPLTMRLFKSEIEQIEKAYPDIVEMFTSGERGQAKITGNLFKDTKFDFQITSGSTYKVDKEQDLNNSRSLLMMALDPQAGGQLNQALAKKGKTLDIAELFQRVIVSSGTQDWDKIIIDIPPDQMGTQVSNPTMPNSEIPQEMLQGQPQMGGQPPQQPISSPIPQQVPPQPQITQPPQPQQTMQDPDIQAFAQQLFR